MPGDAAARGAAFGQQTETMLLDALLGLAGFQCCSVSKQAHSAPRSELNTDPSVRGDHSSPGSPKRRASSKASASSRDKAPPAGPRLPEADHHRAEAGAEPTPPPTPPPTSKPKAAAGAWATEGTAAECAARRTACRSTADEGTGGPSQTARRRNSEGSLLASIVPGPSHAASKSASDPLAASSGAASRDGVAATAGAGKLDGRGLVRRPFSSRTMQQYLKAREQKQDTMFRLEQRLVEITCEYGKALQMGSDAARKGDKDKGGLRFVHHAKEELLVEAKKIRTTLQDLRGQVARLQECIDAWRENGQ